jgi:cytochrome b subunit of formate dehydrogenase
VEERSTAGSVLVVTGIVVEAKVCEPVNTVSATAMATIASARSFIVVMLP